MGQIESVSVLQCEDFGSVGIPQLLLHILTDFPETGTERRRFQRIAGHTTRPLRNHPGDQTTQRGMPEIQCQCL